MQKQCLDEPVQVIQDTIFVDHFFHIFIYKQAEIIKIYFHSFKIHGFKQGYTVTFLADNNR